MIDSRKLDPNFKYEVGEEISGSNITRCFTCGTCTAGCPVRDIDDKYNPRKILRMIILGMREEVLSSDFIWLCSTCYTCYDRCPQGVHITDIMMALRNIAVKEGHIHPSFKEQARLVGTFGRLYEVEDFDNKKRQKMGLPPVKKQFDDVKVIIDKTRVKEFVK
ncbi:MAG: 4Fe-4S dicluster domain-containing protein [Thermoplasmata archaeon]|nr:4Fe-4S dicluster domain-containing protein [Thermoplasmata archaeon]